MEIQVTENRPNGRTLRGRASSRLLAEILRLQYAGGFKRFSVDIYAMRGGKKPGQPFIPFILSFL